MIATFKLPASLPPAVAITVAQPTRARLIAVDATKRSDELQKTGIMLGPKTNIGCDYNQLRCRIVQQAGELKDWLEDRDCA
jgi:hypothetical protein